IAKEQVAETVGVALDEIGGRRPEHDDTALGRHRHQAAGTVCFASRRRDAEAYCRERLRGRGRREQEEGTESDGDHVSRSGHEPRTAAHANCLGASGEGAPGTLKDTRCGIGVASRFVPAAQVTPPLFQYIARSTTRSASGAVPMLSTRTPKRRSAVPAIVLIE